MYLALAGGVGGAKMAHGLAAALPPGKLSVIVNTGDDSEHFGLLVSPDVDTVMYTLAGLNNAETGWGLAGESWNFMDAVEKLGGPTWFRLGDRDLATKAERTRRLKGGESLSAITLDFCEALGVPHAIAPMTDDPVRTLVETDEGVLAFHDYFVRRQCKPKVSGLVFDGIENARPGAPFVAALQSPDLRAIILCPSNPYLSIAPILAVPGVRDLIARAGVPVVAVSPIIGGAAVKGPAAKMMAELGMPASTQGIARIYAGLIDGLVVDSRDAAEAEAIEGPAILATDILIPDIAARQRLATEVIAFAEQLRQVK